MCRVTGGDFAHPWGRGPKGLDHRFAAIFVMSRGGYMFSVIPGLLSCLIPKSDLSHTLAGIAINLQHERIRRRNGYAEPQEEHRRR